MEYENLVKEIQKVRALPDPVREMIDLHQKDLDEDQIF
jgi:gamma-glutamyl phosphate reductase